MDISQWEIGIKLDLSGFHGGLPAEELLGWINLVDEILAFKKVPDDMSVSLMATHFKGQASVCAGIERIISSKKLKC